MARFVFQPLPASTPALRRRYDLAAATDTPAGISPLLNSEKVYPGVVSASDPTDDFVSALLGPDGVAVLYQKEIDLYGMVIGTPVRLGGVDPAGSPVPGGEGPAPDLSGYLTVEDASATYQTAEQVQALIDTAIAALDGDGGGGDGGGGDGGGTAPAVGPALNAVAGTLASGGFVNRCLAQSFHLSEALTVEQIVSYLSGGGIVQVGVATSLGSTPAAVSYVGGGAVLGVASGPTAVAGDTATYTTDQPFQLPAGDYFLVWQSDGTTNTNEPYTESAVVSGAISSVGAMSYADAPGAAWTALSGYVLPFELRHA